VTELARRADRRGLRLAVETGTESGTVLRTFLESLAEPCLAASVDPGFLLRMGHDPARVVAELGPLVVHAYARDATALGDPSPIANPRGFGFAPGVLDWETYLGSLEEVNYDGFLTVWPDSSREPDAQFLQYAELFRRF
jgi:sugar phosphate isomerase/epimerase